MKRGISRERTPVQILFLIYVNTPRRREIPAGRPLAVLETSFWYAKSAFEARYSYRRSLDPWESTGSAGAELLQSRLRGGVQGSACFVVKGLGRSDN